jgi:hypothetical protein
MRRVLRAAFGVALALITFVTFCPVEYRPTTGDLALERFVVFALLGGFAALAFPGRLRRNLILVAAIALVLEAGQRLAPTRHGEVADALEKAAGGAAGVLLADTMTAGAPMRRRRRRRRSRTAASGAGQKMPQSTRVKARAGALRPQDNPISEA